MSFTHVQGTINSSAGSILTPSVSFGSAVTSGNVVTGVVGWQGDAGGFNTLTSLTDDKSNAYTVLPVVFDAGTQWYWVSFYSTAALTNGPTTISAVINAAVASFDGMIIDEWNGLGAGSTSSSGNNSNVAASSTSAAVSTASSDLVIGYVTNFGGGTITPGQTSAQNSGNYCSEWTTASSGSQTMTATASGGSKQFLQAFSLTPSGSSGGSVSLNEAASASDTVGIVGLPTNTTFYVSPSGSDSNNGTSTGTPWQTVGHVNAQIYSYGDTVLFQGGQTFTDAGLSLGTANYDATNPPNASHLLTIGSYGTGNATIAPTGAHGIEMTNIGYYEIENLTVTGDNTSGKNGVWVNLTGAVSTLADITLSSLTISNFGQCGIYAISTSYSVTVTDLTITGCVIHDCSGGTGISGQPSGGIYVSGAMGGDAHPTSTTRIFSSPLVSNCTVYNCNGASGTGNATSGQGVAVQSSTNALITNCLVHDCGANNQAGNGPTGLMYISCTTSVIQFCEVYNISTGNGSDGDGIDLDGDTSGCTIEYCYVHACFGFGLMLYSYSPGDNNNNTLRWNIVQNCGNSNYPAVSVAGNSPSGGKIYNNTIFCAQGLSIPCAAGLSGSGDAVFYNNIFYQAQNFVNMEAVGTGYTFDGNCYYNPNGGNIANYNGTNYSTLTAFQSGASQEAHGVEGNPVLLNAGNGGNVGGYAPPAPTAYDLLMGSPAIDAGLNLSSLHSINPGTQDFYGNAIPNASGYNIGAYGALPNSAFTAALAEAGTAVDVVKITASSVSLYEFALGRDTVTYAGEVTITRTLLFGLLPGWQP